MDTGAAASMSYRELNERLKLGRERDSRELQFRRRWIRAMKELRLSSKQSMLNYIAEGAFSASLRAIRSIVGQKSGAERRIERRQHDDLEGISIGRKR
jgi:hypothetical protein